MIYLAIYTLVTLVFFVTFYLQRIPMDDVIIAKLGVTGWTISLLFVAASWPVGVPISIFFALTKRGQ